MLEKLEMHDIQDKTRLLDEMNETREGVNRAFAEINALGKRLADHKKHHETKPPQAKPKPKAKDKAKSNVASDPGFQKA